jgi:hypothetical protein
MLGKLWSRWLYGRRISERAQLVLGCVLADVGAFGNIRCFISVAWPSCFVRGSATSRTPVECFPCEHSDVTPDGIDFVLINGQVVIDHGKHTGLHPGRVLYGPGYTK